MKCVHTSTRASCMHITNVHRNESVAFRQIISYFPVSFSHSDFFFIIRFSQKIYIVIKTHVRTRLCTYFLCVIKSNKLFCHNQRATSTCMRYLIIYIVWVCALAIANACLLHHQHSHLLNSPFAHLLMHVYHLFIDKIYRTLDEAADGLGMIAIAAAIIVVVIIFKY